MTPEELRAAFLKSRGLNLDSSPVPQIPVQTVPITPTEPAAAPIRMPPPEAVQAWRTGVNQDIAKGVAGTPQVPPMPPTPPPVKPPAAFPTEAPAVPYSNPAVAQTGTTLTSTPIDPNAGWAASIGQSNPDAAKAFDKGTDWGKALGSLDEIAKGLKPKAPAANPFPVMQAEQLNQPNQMAYQLMAAMMNKPRGLTLTGR